MASSEKGTPPEAQRGSHDEEGEESHQPTKKRGREEGEQEKKEKEVEEDEKEGGGEEGVDVNRILVCNETDMGLQHNKSLRLSIRKPDGRTQETRINLPSRSIVDVTVYRGWTLKLNRSGFMFRGDVQVKDDETKKDKDPDWGKPRVMLDELGRVFHVIENPDQRPVTEEEVKAAPDLIVTCLECGGGVPSSFLDSTKDCWVWIATQLGRQPKEAAHVKESVKSDLACASRTSWNKLYDARCAILPHGSPHAEQLKELMLEKRSVGIVVYFRALDRFPGGNADWAVLKFKTQFDLSSSSESTSLQQGSRGKQQIESEENWSVNWMVYRNWDGQASITSRPVERESLPHDDMVAKLLKPLADLVGASEQRSVDTTITDRAMDSEESDTEWSSVEVLVYVPREQAEHVGIKLATSSSSSSSSPSSSFSPTSNTESFLVKAKDSASSSCLVKEEWPLAFRLHQRAVPVKKEQQKKKKKRLNSKVNATQEAHAMEVIEGARTLFHLAKVCAALEDMDDPTDVQLEMFTDVYVPAIFLIEQ